ncbi:MAG: hypothetical protein MR346_04370 [Clostridium sp.]|nr:hypothetical protein [Clostridium sp.]
MQSKYWQEYWDNYYKFMAVYLGGLQEAYDDVDIKKEYLEVSRLFEPSMPPTGYENNQNNNNNNSTQQDNNNLQQNNNSPMGSGDNSNSQPNNNGDMSINDALSTEYFMIPEINQGPGPVIQPGVNQGPGPVIPPGSNQSPQPFTSPGPFVSPGGGQFTINNCRRMAVVRIEARRGFNPQNFYMIVDRADRRSIQGYRIACENNRIRFVPMAIEYRNINVIECAL